MNGIRYNRIRSGMCIADISQKVNINKHILEKLETTDDKSCDSAALFLKLSDFYNVTVDSLLRQGYPEVLREDIAA